MSYKELFNITLRLISSPASAWEEISLEDRRKVHAAFVYPMIALCASSVFLGNLITNGWGGPLSFRFAMTDCCGVAVSLFAGYFLAAYLINEAGVRFFGLPHDAATAQQLAGYSLVVTFLIKIVLGIFPDLALFGILLQFYIVYIVWEGGKRLMALSDGRLLHFTLLASLALLVCPFVIEWVFNRLAPAM